MATKKAKKMNEQKEVKAKERKEKKGAASKKAEVKNDVPKINAIVKDGLSAKPPLSYEEILKNVLKYHPKSRFNKKHLSWYKNKLGFTKNTDK